MLKTHAVDVPLQEEVTTVLTYIDTSFAFIGTHKTVELFQ